MKEFTFDRIHTGKRMGMGAIVQADTQEEAERKVRLLFPEIEHEYDTYVLRKSAQFPPVPNEKYETLQYILEMAYKQASEGKGAIRHGDDERWDNQLINVIQGWGLPYAQGQAVKKIVESVHYFGARGDAEGAVDELLGAIVYLAAAIHNLAEKEPE